MLKVKKWVLLCLMAIFPAILFAAKLPHLCRVSGLRFSDKSIVLFSQHTAKPRMYVIHNISHEAIWLNHEVKDRGVSAGWSSPLLPNHWSAILVTDRNFDLQCHFLKKSGGAITLPCKKVVTACQFSEFYSHNPISGGYWVAENVLLRALVPRISARGFVLPEQPKRSIEN